MQDYMIVTFCEVGSPEGDFQNDTVALVRRNKLFFVCYKEVAKTSDRLDMYTWVYGEYYTNNPLYHK